MIHTDYDIAIVGLGPAGATLARMLKPGLSILALDAKRKEHGEDGGFHKPCGGLLAPDAQRALARFNLTLPLRVLVDPQIFFVRTIDAVSGLIRNYPRHYINLNRHAFDHWLISLIPDQVHVRKGARCTAVERMPGGYRLSWRELGASQDLGQSADRTATARYLVGADGASSFVRSVLRPGFRMRKYTAIQQWFEDRHPKPFYSCVFDDRVTDCYAWGLTKNQHFIFGGAFDPRHAPKRFDALKETMRTYAFRLDHPVKTEACLVLRPQHPAAIDCGGDGLFLLGEAAGFISPSSLEGLSYAFDSARKLAAILNSDTPAPEDAYFRATLDLRLKLLGKIAKCPFIFSPPLRRLVMRSGIGSISVLEADSNSPSQAPSL